MPIDWDKLRASNTITSKLSNVTEANRKQYPWVKGKVGGNVVTRNNVMADYLEDMIRNNFPDYQQASNASMTNVKAADGVVAETGGYLGNDVSLGKLQKSAIIYDVDGSVNRNNPDTSDVIDALGITLHELMHTRQAKDKSGRQKLFMPESVQKDKSWLELLKDAEVAGFPSMGYGFQNGDTLNEFLASAVAIKDMQSRDIQPTGTLARAAKALPALEKKYDWLTGYIESNRQPENPGPNEYGPPEPGFIDKLKQAFGVN